jgi:hypothetical protein
MIRIGAMLMVFAAVLLSAATPLSAETSSSKIRLQSCVLDAFGEGNIDSIAAMLKVRFVNESERTLKRIVWRSQTPAGTIDFADSGTFSPGISVYRHPIYKGKASKSGRFALQLMGPGVCTVIQTEAADGEVWKASGIAAAAIDVPSPPPDSATPVPATFDNPEHNPIGIISCRFSLYWGRGVHGTVRFRNLSPRPIDSITFRGLFGEAGIDVVKHGIFTPGAFVNSGDMIRHELPANVYQEYETLDSPASCVAVSVHYVDGTVWQNPSVSPVEPPFPAGLP